MAAYERCHPMPHEKFASAKETAKIIGVSPVTIGRWGRRGLISRIKITRKTILYNLKELLEQIEKSPTPEDKPSAKLPIPGPAGGSYDS